MRQNACFLNHIFMLVKLLNYYIYISIIKSRIHLLHLSHATTAATHVTCVCNNSKVNLPQVSFKIGTHM